MINFLISVNDKEKKVSVSYDDSILLEDTRYEVEITKLSDYSYLVRHKGKVYDVTVNKTNDGEYNLTLDGYAFNVKAETFIKKLSFSMFEKTDESSSEIIVKSPMPGLLSKMYVKNGDKVEKGTPLFCLEAMKMENVIKAEYKGVISKIFADEGISVEKNKKLLTVKKSL
jgi:propionyl-CoA carboxylase alpha chain